MKKFSKYFTYLNLNTLVQTLLSALLSSYPEVAVHVPVIRKSINIVERKPG